MPEADDFYNNLRPYTTPGAEILQDRSGAWRLQIPAGAAGHYRLAQLDDYHHVPRKNLAWQAPVHLSLQARASAEELPGTWGFGLWNDPFGAGLFNGGELARLPVLPNTAWFFFASPPNYLSLRDDLPAQGSLAATFRSPVWPSLFSVLALPALPFNAIRQVRRWLRQIGRRFVQQSAATLPLSTTEWRQYDIAWQASQVQFFIDGGLVLETHVSPVGPLGLVFWIDNQYAAFPPEGRLRWGTLENPQSAWIEIKSLSIYPRTLDNPLTYR